MFFSQIGQYALRIMTTIAADQTNPLRAMDIAERTGVPGAYVSKVLRRLTTAGLLESQKGHHGGFRLGRAPAKIRFSDVLEAVDSLPEFKSCVFGWGTCKTSDPCPLHPAWSELSADVAHWGKHKTLADALKDGLTQAERK